VAVRVIIFDCDGVLFLSEGANLAFYNEVLRRAGQQRVSPSAEAACHTLASTQLFDRMFADRPDVLARVRLAAQEVDYGPFYDLMTPRPGLYGTLSTLGSAYRLAMATNRGRTATGVIDRFGLRPYLELTVGVLDVARPKPHPDMLVRCVDHFGVNAHEAVYVGDQEIDAAAARAAGLNFVAMGAAVASARHRIEGLEELAEFVARM